MDENRFADNGPFVKLFNKRNAVYKLGFMLLFPSLVIYTLSFCFDSWFSSRGVGSSFGFWQKCYDERVRCENKLNVIVALQVISFIFLAGICITIVLGFLENCHPRPANYHSRKVEWTALSTALIGTVESFVFLMYFISLWRVNLGISFFLNAISVALLFVAGGLMACGHRNTNSRLGTVVTSQITPEHQPMTTVYYSPRPPVQNHIYNYHVTPNLPPHPGLPYNLASSSFAAPPPAYGSYPIPPSGSPPPPYVLPPMYPHQGSRQPNLPPPYSLLKQQDEQQQLGASAPLLSESEMKQKM